MAKGTILVTGGAGYIGSHVVKQLGAAGERVVVLDNLSRGYRQAVTSGELIVGEVGDQALVAKIVADHQVETVMHFAAYTIVPESVSEPLKYYGNNTCSTRALLQVCAEQRVKHVVFSSTAAVYGIPAGGVASDRQYVAQRAPGIRQVGFQCHRTFQRIHGFRVLARLAQRQAQFIVRGSPAVLRVGQGLEGAQRDCGIARTALGNPQQQCRHRMIGRHLEYFTGLLERQRRITLQQACGVRQSRVDATGGVRGARHASVSQKRRIRRVASCSTASSVAKQARTKPCAPAPNAAPSRSETPSAR